MLRLGIARAREGVDGPSLRAGHLCDDVSGRAKAVDAEVLAVARHHQRAPADQAGAHKGGKFRIVPLLADWKTIPRVRDQMARETAIPRIAGELRVIAEI